MKAEAARTNQRGAEHLGAIVGEFAGEAATDLLAAEQRADEGIVERRVLVGDEFAFPGSVTDTVAADRPEVRTAPQQFTVPQDENAAVAASHAVEHVDVDGVKPVPHWPDRRSAPYPLMPCKRQTG